MNELDTEIRRAMGELADAAPPAREPDSFRRDIDDRHGVAASGTSRWLLAAVAAVVVGLVGVVLVVSTSDDPPGTITQDPIVTEPTAALTDDALLAELSGRRWVALERFDDPSPTARTPEFTVTTSSAGASIAGFDGCNTYGGAFRLEGATVGAGEIASTTIGCDVETLSVGGSIELFPDSATLLLSDRDGTPAARFHDLAQLTPASADDMPYTFFADELDSVAFVVSGVGFTSCTRVGWEGSTDGVRVELLETDGGCLVERPLDEWLAAIAEPGAEAFVTPDGILLANESSTLQLRRLPVVDPDPDGVTLAAAVLERRRRPRDRVRPSRDEPVDSGATDRIADRGRRRRRRPGDGDSRPVRHVTQRGVLRLRPHRRRRQDHGAVVEPGVHAGQRRLTHPRWAVHGGRRRRRRLRCPDFRMLNGSGQAR